MISIGIPTYNGEQWIGETLKSILGQDFSDFEIVVSDDNSKDRTLDVIRGFCDRRIKIFSNHENLGYGKNLKALNSLISGDVLFLMGQDDILFEGVLSKIARVFLSDKEIAAVTRPYYWFNKDINKPVRAVFPYCSRKDTVVSVLDGRRAVEKIFESAGQLSGLAFRRECMEIGFHEDIFPSHIYPLAQITKKYKVMFLKDFTVAVRIESSQTRSVSKIYSVSPTESWVKMFTSVYKEEKFRAARDAGIRQICTHFLGLVQIKNYGSFKNLIREIFVLVKYRPLNLLDFRFWFFSLGTIITPRFILKNMTDRLKGVLFSMRQVFKRR